MVVHVSINIGASTSSLEVYGQCVVLVVVLTSLTANIVTLTPPSPSSLQWLPGYQINIIYQVFSTRRWEILREWKPQTTSYPNIVLRLTLNRERELI